MTAACGISKDLHSIPGTKNRYKIVRKGGWEIVERVRCLPCTHKDLSLDHEYPHKCTTGIAVGKQRHKDAQSSWLSRFPESVSSGCNAETLHQYIRWEGNQEDT